jgi:hypothetical protein
MNVYPSLLDSLGLFDVLHDALVLFSELIILAVNVNHNHMYLVNNSLIKQQIIAILELHHHIYKSLSHPKAYYPYDEVPTAINIRDKT